MEPRPPLPPEPPPGSQQGNGVSAYQYHDTSNTYGPPAPGAYPHPQSSGTWGSNRAAPGMVYGERNAGYQHTGSYAVPPGYEQGAAYSGYHPPTGPYGQYGSARAAYHQYTGGYATHGYSQASAPSVGAASAKPNPQPPLPQNAYAAASSAGQTPVASASGNVYNAVPPPSSLLRNTRPRDPGASAQPLNPSLVAAKAAAASIAEKFVAGRNNPIAGARTGMSGQQQQVFVGPQAPTPRPGMPTSIRPAFLRVDVPPKAATPQQQMIPPSTWPSSLKAYVERSFVATPLRLRAKLQQVLKSIVGDAQQKGELWTRNWDALPPPDLALPVDDAASLVGTVASVSEPASAAVGPKPAAHFTERLTTRPGWVPKEGLTSSSEVKDRWPGTADLKRISRPSLKTKPHKKKRRTPMSTTSSSSEEEDEQAARRAAQRAGRFGDGAADDVLPSSFAASRARRAQVLRMLEQSGGALPEDETAWDALSIKGTSTSLEKSYYRLPSAPDPATVRPEPVLRQALDRLTARIAGGEVGYFYALDQFKGMRQDCTVQHLRGDLTRRVYESHARAALEYGDMPEYNQCQGRLFALQYGSNNGGGESVGGSDKRQGLNGNVSSTAFSPPTMTTTATENDNNNKNSTAEFLAYRILYQAAHAQQGEGGPALQRTLCALRADPAIAVHPIVRHALAAQRALAAGECARFCRLRAVAPRLSAALMDLALPRLRFATLGAYAKAFRPGVEVADLARALGFVAPAGSDPPLCRELEAEESTRTEALPGCSAPRYLGEHSPASDEAQGVSACLAWLEECQAVVDRDEASITFNCKDSMGRLVMPAPKEAVAHGDANLDIGDFMKAVATG